MATAPLPPSAPGENAVCPVCGDEAFFVDDSLDSSNDDHFAFSCDSCEYIYFLQDHPKERDAVRQIAVAVGGRTP